MKTVIATTAIALSALCCSCDNGRESELDAQILRLKESSETLEAKVLEQSAEITTLSEQNSQILLEGERVKSVIVGEIRDRLTVIESDYAEAIAYDAGIEEGIEMLREADAQFSAQVKEAAEKHQEFMEMIQTTDPIWAFTKGEDWGRSLAEALVEAQGRNADLKRELDAFKTGRTPTKSPAEQGDADQPATAVDSEVEANEKPKPESERRSQ